MSVKLSWSHYCELLTISDPDKRSFYEKETINSGWSIRELKRQISTCLYERLLLSEGKTNKETVLALAEKGIEMSTPLDIIKDPYVLIELKTTKLTPEAAGQLNMYLNYYAAYLRLPIVLRIIPYPEEAPQSETICRAANKK